jgi:hypothetical protein
MSKKRRIYNPRLVGDKVMMPADLNRLHKYMLEVEHIGIISDEMRQVVGAVTQDHVCGGAGSGGGFGCGVMRKPCTPLGATGGGRQGGLDPETLSAAGLVQYSRTRASWFRVHFLSELATPAHSHGVGQFHRACLLAVRC